MLTVKTPPPAIEEIAKLQAQIQQLKGDALKELQNRKSSIEEELEAIEAELLNLTGKADGRRGKRGLDTPAKRSLTYAELREMLAAAPERTLNIRKQNLDLLNVRTLVHANPQFLSLGGKAPWPTVSLVR